MNSEPVDFSSTRPVSPDTTCSPPSYAVTTAVRVSAPVRTKVWSCGRPSTDARSQPCSSTTTCAEVTGATSSTKCRASSRANSSVAPTPRSFANA